MSISMNSQSALHEVESRCTQERPPRCQSLCPLGLDARAFLGHAAEGRWSDARKQLERYLPLPGLLARVCDHPCEQGCLRGDLGGAVNLHGLEIFCTEHLGVQTRSLPMPRKQKRIAVIGAGLAGLVCAWDLAGKGYPVTVFHEGDPKAQLLSCWPVLAGAGAAALDAEWEALGRRGVRFEQARTDAACLQQAAGEYEGVLLDAGTLPELAPAEDGVDAQILHWRDNICCAGWASVTPTGHRFASASRQAGQGRSAARTLERLVAGVSLTAARDTDERSLYTELDGIAPVERVLPVAEVYSEAEARQEAGRCLQCQCLVCVKACVYLQKYKGYPRVYARQMYNNAAIVKGLHLANNLINGCALCGQCEELCPENFSMAELCLSARQDMVERGVMPPSAHEFALEDMEAASGPEC
ncbi:4Fe-4S dicluster domain-containing protein, partial [Desulfovibrio sp.]